MKRQALAGWAAIVLTGVAWAASPEDVLKQIDPATGKAKDTTTAFELSGIVSVRTTLAEGQVLAFVQLTGTAGVPVLAGKADADKLIPRNEVSLTGTLGDGPLGFAALRVKDGSVGVGATNKTFGAAEPRGAEFFKDASSLAGRYVSLTNVTFADAKFDGSGKAKVKGDGGEVTVLLTKALKDHEVPAGAVNVFGVPVRVEGEWRLLAARFLSVKNKETMALATKRTCFTCHNPDVKAVGPAYRDVAAKYKDDPEALAKLQLQMEKGGSGKWGVVPMPPLGASVPPDERRQLAEWILGYRWDALLAQ
jgi:cytochrome c